MSTRRLALVGASEGPWVYTAGVQDPHLRIRGLGEAELLLTQRNNPIDEHQQLFKSDGAHPIPKAAWMRVSCLPPVKSVIAEIISGAE